MTENFRNTVIFNKANKSTNHIIYIPFERNYTNFWQMKMKLYMNIT